MSYSHLPPLRLLSLDGGGVRGLSSLMILKDLMEAIADEERRLGLRAEDDGIPLKPCDYFDLIGGTSTGGIIAILLSRLRLDVPTCISIYTRLAEDVFKKDRCINILGLRLRIAPTRFSGIVLENTIKSVLKDHGFDPEEKMWDQTLFEDDDGRVYGTAGPKTLEVSEAGVARDVIPVNPPSPSHLKRKTSSVTSSPISPTAPKRHQLLKKRRSTGLAVYDEDGSHLKHMGAVTAKKPSGVGCHGLVTAVYKNAIGTPKIFSTYDPNDKETCIWQALRATSAAPTFFEECAFGTPRITYIDGGLGYNSPCVEVDFEAKSLWKGRQVGCIVSVGTGLQTAPSINQTMNWLPFGLQNEVALAAAVVQMATSTARVDNEVQRMYRDTPTEYYRWDVDSGLGNISLEQWMKEDEIGSATKRYMTDPDQLIRTTRMAKSIVRLSADPKTVECPAGRFKIGLKVATGDQTSEVRDGKIVPCWQKEEVDLKTGDLMGLVTSANHNHNMQHLAQLEGMALPVRLDLDGDGRRDETQIINCRGTSTVCLRTLIKKVPQGRYKVKFVVRFLDEQGSGNPSLPLITQPQHSELPGTAAGANEQENNGDSKHRTDIFAVGAPINVIFSAGTPNDPHTFERRYVDPQITPDIVPVLLRPDAVRVRTDKDMWTQHYNQGWFEIEGDVDIEVGMGGAVGIVVNKIWEPNSWVSGWSFGGVRLEPTRPENYKFNRGGSKRGLRMA